MDELLAEIRACRRCEASLPLGPRPVVQAGGSARVVVVGQAPGRQVHASGIPWDDRSGRRLREWLGTPLEAFYDRRRVALVPMGFCYPGAGPSGDAPPRPECAPTWHGRLWPRLRGVALWVLVGRHAQAAYDPVHPRSLTRAVRSWPTHPPGLVVLPHPSPRNNGWLSANPWFEAEVLPVVRRQVAAALAGELEDSGGLGIETFVPGR
jgi:uracil-DNA glycosylase